MKLANAPASIHWVITSSSSPITACGHHPGQRPAGHRHRPFIGAGGDNDCPGIQQYQLIIAGHRQQTGQLVELVISRVGGLEPERSSSIFRP